MLKRTIVWLNLPGMEKIMMGKGLLMEFIFAGQTKQLPK